MAVKHASHRYFWLILPALLVACVGRTVALSTQTPLPTPASTSTSFPAIITPSPFPMPPIISMITPDAIQVARWREYETAMATALFPSSFIPDKFLCEWEILGRADQEVYVWAVCMSTFSAFFIGSVGYPYQSTTPAVIHIGKDGAVQNVEIPRGGSSYASDIRRMFPPNAQERYFEGLIHFQELTDHLNWRREHPEEPPLIVLSATPIP